MIYIGIDPGASGGLAAITGQYVQVIPMPATERDLWDWIAARDPMLGASSHAVVERNTGFVGGKGNPGSAMYKFGRSTGLIVGMLTAAHIPFAEITPRVWQHALGITPRKRTESKTAWKNRLKAVAQKLFPMVAVTLLTCDALLIAHYCRLKQEGRLA